MPDLITPSPRRRLKGKAKAGTKVTNPKAISALKRGKKKIPNIKVAIEDPFVTQVRRNVRGPGRTT